MTSDEDPAEAADSPAVEKTRGKRPAPRGTAAYPRKRAVTACQVCRARRTKCDNAKPACSFCQKVGAVCIQSPVDLSSFDPASIRILERLDDLEKILKRSELPQQYVDPNSIEKVDWTPEPDLQLLPGNLEDRLAWPCLQACHGRPKTNLLAILRQPMSGSPMSTFVPSPASTSADLEPRTTRVLVDKFFRYCHVKNPILTNEPAVRRMISQISLHGIDWSANSCRALLICALGAISTPFGDSQSTLPGTVAYTASQSYFQAAQKRLGSLVAVAGVVEAQCLFLAGVYSMCIFRPTNAWRYFCQALACCQEFDFITRAAPNWGDIDTFETQADPEPISIEEQAIYWSSWKSERELRSALQPQDYLLPERERALYPPFFPTPPPPSDETPEEMEGVQATHEKEGWYFYLTEISLRRLSSRLLADILSLKTAPQQTFMNLLVASLPAREAQVSEWARNLPREMSLDSPPEDDEVTRFVIRGHLVHLYEMLYWPYLDAYFATCDATQSIAGSSRLLQTTSRSVKSHLKELAEKSLQVHMERMRVNRPGFRHRHHGTWFMIRSCTESALVIIKAALRIQQSSAFGNDASRLIMPTGWKDAILDAINLNRYWEGKFQIPRSGCQSYSNCGSWSERHKTSAYSDWWRV